MVSILMYHALVEQPEPYLAAVHVAQARFAEQMAWLAASGHRVLPLAEALATLRQPAAPAASRPVVALTFDDGYHSLYTHAQPVLRQHGFAATLFLTTAPVGQPSYASLPEFARSAPLGDRPLTWDELRALAAAGWRIEAHGCTHRPLDELPTGQLVAELRQSRAVIARQLGRAPSFYAFPYGRYDRRVLRALGLLGYQAGLAVHTGLALPSSDLRRLPRIEVTAACDLAAFQQKVATGYASPAEAQRAQLRNLAYRVPVVRDALQRVLRG
ncbi:MAG: polysaccharide deacetylase family protein [Hymenobacter sp.]|nr:MAG: polysaccharide deacetylase family protein [Hymenobacter sp.]